MEKYREYILGSMHHNLKTPLNGMLLYTEVLKN